MSRSSKFGALALAATLAAGVFAASPALAGGEIAVTEQHKKTCTKAEARYKDLYPDAKPYGKDNGDGTVTVLLYKYTFCPVNVTVKKGTTVRWVNVDKRTSHSVWMKAAGQEESERFFPEEEWSFPFQATGDYPYLCGPHWDAEKMIGFVRVTD